MTANSNLFSFIFLTVKASINNPKSKNFLPTLLAAIQDGGAPLLPLKEDSWTIGSVTGSSGLLIAKNIADKYQLVNSQPVIPYPKGPDPYLELKDTKGVEKVVINGLDNAYVTDFNNYNYDNTTNTVTADINMQFNYWTKNPGGLQPGQKVPQLGISTPFNLTQKLCKVAATGDKTCEDPSAQPIEVIGNGIFTANITQLNFIASISINVVKDRAGLNLAITNLKLITTGADAPKFADVKATLSNQSPYSDLFSTFITSFMAEPEASAAIFPQMQASLNTPGNINSLSKTMTSQFATLLNNRLGPVTGQLPSDSGQTATNKVDLYLFDRIRYALNDTSSNWYVQTLLKSYKNPSLNPFKPKDLNIGSFTLPGLGFKFTNVILSDIVVTGFPNATAPADTLLLTPPTTSLMLLLGSLGAGTSAVAQFSADYPGGHLNLGLTVAVKSVELTSVVLPSGADVSELVITFNSIDYKIPNVADMKITLDDQSGLGPAIQQVLNSADVQNKMVSAANSELASNIPAISSEVTSIIKTLLEEQI